MNKGIKAALIVVLLALFSAGAYGAWYVNNIYKSLDVQTISTEKEDLGITEEAEVKINMFENSKEVINILLLGTDKREPDENSRSDSMMILSIDPVNNNLKLSSLMRDTYVKIKGYGSDKLAHAYAYGGAPLALNTVNTNFGMNIEYYAVINYGGLINVIDALGGVEIDIKDYEIDMVNSYIGDVAKVEDVPYKEIETTGPQTLTGVQAVGYARVRYVGDGDFERTERQRSVLTSIFNKFKEINTQDIPGVAAKLAPNVETNLSLYNMVRIGTSVINAGMKNVLQARFPTDDHGYGKLTTKWFYFYEKAETIEELHDFIYENEIPESQKPEIKNED
ncbi:LCP family protein [Youngiibacter multivorans]|uniref:LCP family protein required for cell wall assembly n=1 Tax=Youngiibacter multivorans TaxID=937251 RepID=A0ABS4G577_9CLOT|nr:LCP family protein [Youngiibacter multivorans]MBP1919671.1 LCP family protein required for cell wall assembly [Youngiibacter multivorans]